MSIKTEAFEKIAEKLIGKGKVKFHRTTVAKNGKITKPKMNDENVQKLLNDAYKRKDKAAKRKSAFDEHIKQPIKDFASNAGKVINDHASLKVTGKDLKEASKLIKRKDGQSYKVWMRIVKNKAKEVRKEKLIKAGIVAAGAKVGGIGAYIAMTGDNNETRNS